MVEQKPTPLRPWTMKRRSQRLVLSVPVVVHRPTAEGPSFSEGTHTLAVSAHGALVAMSANVVPEQTVVVQNSLTGEEVTCRVGSTERKSTGRPEVAIEFKQSAPSFWHIAFPPTDWTPNR